MRQVKQLAIDKPETYVVGDMHGDFSEIDRFCRDAQTRRRGALLILAGDIGMGFSRPIADGFAVGKLEILLEKSDSVLVAIRGNHDDPGRFGGWITDRIHFAADYTVLETPGASIQLVGGAISVDRILRRLNYDYWANEAVVFDPALCRKVDVLVTHAHPERYGRHRFPDDESLLGYLDMERRQTGRDTLVEEVHADCARVQQISDATGCRTHCFGHLHISDTLAEDGREYRCHGVKEIRRLD